jgi:Bacterial virulence factor lipase N-terminal/Platelet-activating factor acetylhydrolase, isoform II
MERLIMAACFAAALFLGACSGSNGAVSPVSMAGVPAAVTHAKLPSATAALFKPLQGILPYPTDLYFAGSSDGTVNMQPEDQLTSSQVALNTLDGFSTTAVIRARFSGSLDPASFTAQTVNVLQVTIDSTTKAITGVVQPLVYGVDYTTGLGPESDVGNTILEIRPTHPLVPSTGDTNNGYLILLTKGIASASGTPVIADSDYSNIKAALPTCSSITDASLNDICQLTGAHLQIAKDIGINPEDVVLSFSFSTQSIADSLEALQQTATAQPIAVRSTGLTTAQANPHLSGHATIFVGTLAIPYYLSRTAPLTGFWHGNPSPLDSSSRFLTRFNPMPVPTETLQVPILVTVPNAHSAMGGHKPAGGKWPVLIFAHGIFRNRTDMLAVADAFADSGFVVAAIDLPLHGITDATNIFYAARGNPLYAGLPLPPSGSIERTFDLDVINNATGAPEADGQVDPSGASFINLTSILTTRDNLREAAADLITLARSLPDMKLDADPAGDIDPAAIHFLGHSFGGIAGGVYLGVAASTDISTGTLAMPGGGIAALLRDSPTFGPRVAAALRARGIVPGSTEFEQLIRDTQTAVDPGDPVNYIATAAAHHPIHLIQIIGSDMSPPDQVVPNSATQRLIDAAALTRVPAPAAAGVRTDSKGFRAYLSYIVGSHSSLVDPTASTGATMEMQGEAISFAGAGIPTILPNDNATPPFPGFAGLAPTQPGSTLLILAPTVLQP